MYLQCYYPFRTVLLLAAYLLELTFSLTSLVFLSCPWLPWPWPDKDVSPSTPPRFNRGFNGARNTVHIPTRSVELINLKQGFFMVNLLPLFYQFLVGDVWTHFDLVCICCWLFPLSLFFPPLLPLSPPLAHLRIKLLLALWCYSIALLL